MDPDHLFVDQPMLGVCVYCGGEPDTRDHVPSRVLLDEPYPDNLPVVECCTSCNEGFSLDEQYVSCLIDCVLAGSTKPEDIIRTKVARILRETPSLSNRIAKAEIRTSDGQQMWQPEIDRVHDVVLKLARGHAAYDLSVLEQLEIPTTITCVPLPTLDDLRTQQFFGAQETPFWPEIGNRAFIRACKESTGADGWHVIQRGRYQYLVCQTDGLLVQVILSDYLACEVRWG